MSRSLGLVLRLVGPLIQFLALFAYLEYRGRGARLLGVPVESLCFTAIGLGLLLVLAGLALSYHRPRPRSRARTFDLDLGPDEPRD